MTAWTKTTCAYCGVGCGIEVRRTGERSVDLRGDADHPANFGKLCGKGASLNETLGLEGRLLQAKVGGKAVPVDDALDHVAERLTEIRRNHGPDAIAFYLSGQLLTEDYYVANKFMKGFVGSANVDTNSRLCMSSAVAAHKRAFGEDIVPGNYEDFDLADLTVFAGSNAAWCHPVLFQRTEAARAERGTRIVAIDPRRSATADVADLHLALKPGSDVVLFNGLASFLVEQGLAVRDLPEAFDVLSVAEVAALCDLDRHDVRTFYEWVAETPKWLTVFSQGINQSSQGTDKGNAIINAHLLSGRFGKPGMGPFSITGQPNAMGGREVGGLANMLAAHMGFEPEHVDRVGRFWNATNMATEEGLKAVDLFEAIGRGDIKAVWIMGTNPAVSMPDAARVRKALAACDLVIVSDCVEETDTMAYADVALPVHGWGEKNGTVTNSERRISRQRGFLSPPGEARADWELVCGVARRMGFGAAFAYGHAHEIFAEHAALSGFENDGDRYFDISELGAVGASDYDALSPIQWPVRGGTGTDRLLGAQADTLSLISTSPRLPGNLPEGDFPYALNTGRTRDQWHTMTRSGLVPRLGAHVSEPFVILHPEDAEREAVTDGDYVSVRSAHGQITVRAQLSTTVRRGEVYALMHWTDQLTSEGNVGRVVNPVCDPISGQPELKHTPVALHKRSCHRQGYLLSTERIKPDGFGYWAERRLERGYFYSLAALDEQEPGFDNLLAHATHWSDHGEALSFVDAGGGRYRSALVRDGRLSAYLAIGPAGSLPGADWVIDLFGREVDPEDRRTLLAGRPGAGGALGAMVCSCMGVREGAIDAAISEQGAASVEEVGACTGAGTSCGSCKSEITQRIATWRQKTPAGVAA